MKKTWIKNYGKPSGPGTRRKKFSSAPINVQGLDLQDLAKDYRLDQPVSYSCSKCNQQVSTKLYRLIRKNNYLCKQCNIKETLVDLYGIPHPIKYIYRYDNQSFDSSWELALWIYAKDHNEDIEREPISFEYEFENKIKHYIPDFRYNGQLVEVKGSHFFDEDGYLRNPFNAESNLKNRCIQRVALQNGVIYYSDNEIKPILDYINQKYTKDYLQLFKKNLPFPYPQLPKNPNDYDIIRYFHKSIYEASKYRGLSPLQAWQDKKIIKKTALNRLKYVGKCTPRAVLQGLTVARIAPKVSVFKPNLAERLIKTYLNSFETIFDPFSGFSGRMLGATTCNKKYIGQDLNEKHVQESNEIINFKQLQDCTVTQQDILIDSEKTFQNTALFTCPPYSDKEFWTEDKSEVVKTCDEWIDVCLEKYKCDTHLFVVDQTEKYKESVVETIENKSHFGKNNEYVILIQRS